MRDRLVALLASYAGLDPPAWALEARVRERAAALGLDEEGYVARALDDAGELAALTELLRVGETRFFRHRPQLDALVARVLPALGRGPVAAWSAGCASGEEAWTLGMLLAERGVAFSLSATDLSTAALARARAGRYPAARVEADVAAPLVARYFRRIGDELVVNDRLRPHVRFEAHNLLSSLQPRDVDLILCRNVLIYFDDARRAEAVARLSRALRPGGFLLLGYSEALRDAPELVAEGHAIYRKREAAAVRPAPAPRAPSPLPSAPSPHAPAPSPNAPAPPMPPHAPTPSTARGPRTLVLRGDYADPARLMAELRPLVGETHAVVDLDGASFLGDAAARVLKRAAEAAPGLELRATRSPVRRWLVRHGIRAR